MHMPPACADMIRIPLVLLHTKKKDRQKPVLLFGGDGGIRTLDLTDANRTLSPVTSNYFCNRAKMIPYSNDKYKRKEQMN